MRRLFRALKDTAKVKASLRDKESGLLDLIFQDH